ncbi:MAG: hypothetical protein QG597_3111 [Actinomycetota bacterium]|nr:hypothetical protein [Actinomycetota bacterium]
MAFLPFSANRLRQVRAVISRIDSFLARAALVAPSAAASTIRARWTSRTDAVRERARASRCTRCSASRVRARAARGRGQILSCVSGGDTAGHVGMIRIKTGVLLVERCPGRGASSGVWPGRPMP